MLLLALSQASRGQWTRFSAARALATRVVSAEAAKAVSQHGAGLVRLPGDMLTTLHACLKEAGLTGKAAKLRSRALGQQLQALARSTPAGGLQPYRTPHTDGGQVLPLGPQAMTREQLAEQQEMDAELEAMAASFGPDVLHRMRRVREAATSASQISLPTTKHGRLRASAKAALEQHIAVHGVLGLPHEAVRAALDLPPSSTLAPSPEHSQQLQRATPAYDDGQALSYALSRLPGSFAASSRIFRELATRMPQLAPSSVLDYGAGPGTASWAAQEAWHSLRRVTAVERSPAMRRLGAKLEAARRFAHPDAPLVQWRPSLPPLARSQRGRRRQQHAQHEVVVAAYVLTELAQPQQRAALVRQLWGLTSDLLVLVEPGTPAGSANIQEARAAVLQYEARRAVKLQRRLAAVVGADAAASQPGGAEPGGQPSSGSESDDDAGSAGWAVAAAPPDHNLALKAGSKWFGAHVVAPCPHDGPCPLAAAGSQAWCHFSTRFQRPGFMQEAKAPRGARVNPADHQDERYSYVVLRRGPRPLAAADVDVSRTFSAATVRPRAAGGSSTAQQLLALQHEPAPSMGAAAAVAPPAAAGAASGVAVLSSEELQQLSALLVPQAATPPSVPHEQLAAPGCEPPPREPGGAASSEERERYLRVNSKLQQYGEGLVDRLIALEDAGIDWARPGADSLSPEAATMAASHAPPQAVAPPHTSSASAGASSGGGSAPAAAPAAPAPQPEPWPGPWQPAPGPGSSSTAAAAEQAAEQAGEQAGRVWEAAPIDVGAAAAASVSWSRIIRAPRKRGGHVILDVCSADSSHALDGGGGSQGSSTCGGRIVRHVVARSDAAKWMGRAAYALARSAQWGDLWPTSYDRMNPKRQPVNS